jgi:hypothetical protein
MRNLGKITGLVINHLRVETEMHADVEAWGAPGECHGAVNQTIDRARRALFQDIERATGYTTRQLDDELNRRVSGKWLWRSGVGQVIGEELAAQDDLATTAMMKRHRLAAYLPR